MSGSLAAQKQVTAASGAASLPSALSANNGELWICSSGVLLVALIGTNVLLRLRLRHLQKQLKFENFKGRELKKKLKLALKTITKMEQNPDLMHSRDFNLDYLRMRMAEDTFNFAILNTIKIQIKETIALALRPKQADLGVIGVASAGRQIDETFDVFYCPGDSLLGQEKRVLFRIQIRLVKLPTQASSQTIQQLIDCIEAFLSPNAEDDYWQPTIQGRLAHMEWDQKAKPTPLLVLEQMQDGSNVTFRTKKTAGAEPVGT